MENQTTIDEKYMARCIQLAENGRCTTSPNPMVGAVVVYNDRIIGEGYHVHCGEGHAEVNALASVKERDLLPESTIYVSLEPCSHYGKTPPCADLIIRERLKRVVVGCQDPFPEVAGRGIQKLRDAGIEVTVGVLEEECKALNRRFFTAQTEHRPYVTLKWAQSSDGFIDVKREDGKPVVLSSPLTQMLVHKRRAEHEAILVGKRTALLDDPSLTTRLWPGRNPIRVVIDRRRSLPKDLKLFDGSVKTLVFCARTPRKKADIPYNVEYIRIDFSDNREVPHQILKELAARKVQSLLVEGGFDTLMYFLYASAWDEFFAEIAPARLGASGGVKAPLPLHFYPLVRYIEYENYFGRTFIHGVNS